MSSPEVPLSSSFLSRLNGQGSLFPKSTEEDVLGPSQERGHPFPGNARYEVYLHDIQENDWSLASYAKVPQVLQTVEDFWHLFLNLPNPLQVMMFVMREGVTPILEDPDNIEGGYWSYRVPKERSFLLWNSLTMAFLGNRLTVDPGQTSLIQGVTYSPKYSNSILKIWHRDASRREETVLRADAVDGLNLHRGYWTDHRNKHTVIREIEQISSKTFKQ